jgi:hypothetical protein
MTMIYYQIFYVFRQTSAQPADLHVQSKRVNRIQSMIYYGGELAVDTEQKCVS